MGLGPADTAAGLRPREGSSSTSLPQPAHLLLRQYHLRSRRYRQRRVQRHQPCQPAARHHPDPAIWMKLPGGELGSGHCWPLVVIARRWGGWVCWSASRVTKEDKTDPALSSARAAPTARIAKSRRQPGLLVQGCVDQRSNRTAGELSGEALLWGPLLKPACLLACLACVIELPCGDPLPGTTQTTQTCVSWDPSRTRSVRTEDPLPCHARRAIGQRGRARPAWSVRQRRYGRDGRCCYGRKGNFCGEIDALVRTPRTVAVKKEGCGRGTEKIGQILGEPPGRRLIRGQDDKPPGCPWSFSQKTYAASAIHHWPAIPPLRRSVCTAGGN